MPIAIALSAVFLFAGYMAIWSDEFEAGFVAGGTLIGTIVYLWMWAQHQDVLSAHSFEDDPQ